MNARAFWRFADSALNSGKRNFCCIVAEHTIHSPGSTGARLALTSSGEQPGTIGGGIMELDLLDRGRNILSSPGHFEPEIETLVHRESGTGEKSGLICAGEQTNICFVLTPETDGEAVTLAASLTERDQPGLISVSQDGFTCTAATLNPAAPQSTLERHSDGWTYTEQTVNLKRTAIFGGGHCGLALSNILSALGYHVTVIDYRNDLPTLQSNNSADRALVVADMKDAAAEIHYPAVTRAVVMGTDIQSDIDSLDGILSCDFFFAGLMGSPAKIHAIRKSLKDRGKGDAAFDRVVAPVGISINSKTPEEIAVSVAAQMIALDRGAITSQSPG